MTILLFVLTAPAVFPEQTCMWFADFVRVNTYVIFLCAPCKDQSPARPSNTHDKRGAFMDFLDPLFSFHLLSPPPAMTAQLTISHTIGAHVPIAAASSLRPVHPNKD